MDASLGISMPSDGSMLLLIRGERALVVVARGKGEWTDAGVGDELLPMGVSESKGPNNDVQMMGGHLSPRRNQYCISFWVEALNLWRCEGRDKNLGGRGERLGAWNRSSHKGLCCWLASYPHNQFHNHAPVKASPALRPTNVS